MEAKDINQTREFEELLKEALETQAEVFIWDIDGTDVIRVPVTLASIDGYNKKVSFKLDHRAKYYINDLIKGVGMLKFYIPAQQLLFISRIENYAGTNIKVNYPEAFKTHDRRKNDRLEPLIPVYFSDSSLKKECFDISKGGFSFIINNLEFKKMRYEKDTVIDCEIEFPFKKSLIKAKVVNVLEVKPYQLERFPYGAKKISCMIQDNDLYTESFDKLAKGMKKLLIDLL